MKKILFAFAVAMFSLAANAQDIFGKWITGDGDGVVEIYESNGKVNGKVVWLEQGADTRDKHNPDPALKNRKLLGIDLLSGLTKKDKKYEGGKVYDPKSGKTYKCAIWLDGKKLKVRGYLGVFHATQTWKRKE